MSMWLSLCRVNEKALKHLKVDPELMERLFFGDAIPKVLSECGVTDSCLGGVDFGIVFEGHEAMAEMDGETCDDAIEAEFGQVHTLDYDAGYDPAFYIEPGRVAAASEQCICTEMDEDVEALFAQAVLAGEFVVGVIS